MRNTVSEGALIKRINRRIGGYDAKTYTAWGERLRKLRGDRWWTDIGSYYTVDWNTGNLGDRHIDLEQYGREVGALAPDEEVQ
jgi:hypothetical protein